MPWATSPRRAAASHPSAPSTSAAASWAAPPAVARRAPPPRKRAKRAASARLAGFGGHSFVQCAKKRTYQATKQAGKQASRQASKQASASQTSPSFFTMNSHWCCFKEISQNWQIVRRIATRLWRIVSNVREGFAGFVCV